MVKKGTKNKKKGKRNSSFWMSMFILVIMVLSLGGFAFMSGGPGMTNEGGENNLPENLPLKKVENEGQVFWVAIKNSEVFYFMSIDGYEEEEEKKNLAEKIKNKESLDIYVHDSFKSSDALYLIEKALNGLEISHNIVEEKSCNENTLVLTTNENISEGSCLKFVASSGEETKDAEILTYHLVKN